MKSFRIAYRFGPRDLWSDKWVDEDDVADELGFLLSQNAEIKINHYIIK